MAGTGTSAGATRSGHNLLGIYLNDHLAGATGGAGLARRVAGSHGSPAADSTLQRLAAEVAQDRAALLEIMAALSIPVRAYKVYVALIGEKAARLKLNGYLLARSPLSNLEELEMLRLGVEGKAAGWRTLRVLAETDERLDPGRLDELISRARRQADLLEELRVRAQARSSAWTGRPMLHDQRRSCSAPRRALSSGPVPAPVRAGRIRTGRPRTTGPGSR